MRVAKCIAAVTLGALALIAVSYISDDNSSVLAEASTKATMENVELPEDADSFVAVAMSSTKKSKFDPFHIYKWTKEEAAKKAPKASFDAAVDKCKLLRSGSYKKCATFYCAAKKQCGAPCQKLYGSPAKQVIPLAESNGNRFYNVHEVSVKEVHAKEKRAKEIAAKERASKERSRKESAYKEKVTKEKEKKELDKKERVTKEKAFKEKQAKERTTKEKTEKKKEAAHKAQVLLKCEDGSEAVEVTCEKTKAAEVAEKAVAAEGVQKAALKAAEEAKKLEEADAAQYASSVAHTSGTTPALAVYASAIVHEQADVAHKQFEYQSAAAHATVAANNATVEQTEYEEEEASYTAGKEVTAGYNAKLQAYGSAVTAAGQNLEDTTIAPPVLDADEQAANDAAMNYANTVIPPGGQRRLLAAGSGELEAQAEADVEAAATGSAAGSAAGSGAPAAATPAPVTPAPAPITPPPTAFDPVAAAAAVKTLTATVAEDQKARVTDRADAADQVKKSSEADQALTNAQNTFKNAQADEQAKDNDARLHAGKAAFAESKVAAVDSYVGTHRGALHQQTCGDEKKFAFDVCFGRAAYKGQLYQTKKAREARQKADEYKKLMGKDYAIIIKSNSTLITQLATEKAAEQAVEDANEKLENDSNQLALTKEEIKEEKEEKAKLKAEAAKAAEEAAAAKTMAGDATVTAPAGTDNDAEEEAAASGSAPAVVAAAAAGSAPAAPVGGGAAGSAGLMDMEDEFAGLIQDDEMEDEEDFVENTEVISTGRRLLESDVESKKSCHKFSNKAYGECKSVVDDGYSACTRLFQKAMQ